MKAVTDDFSENTLSKARPYRAPGECISHVVLAIINGPYPAVPSTFSKEYSLLI